VTRWRGKRTETRLGAWLRVPCRWWLVDMLTRIRVYFHGTAHNTYFSPPAPPPPPPPPPPPNRRFARKWSNAIYAQCRPSYILAGNTGGDSLTDKKPVLYSVHISQVSLGSVLQSTHTPRLDAPPIHLICRSLPCIPILPTTAGAVGRTIHEMFFTPTTPGDGPLQPGGVPGGPGPQPSQPPETVMLHWPCTCAMVYFDSSPPGAV
jgi:hypothetical protein